MSSGSCRGLAMALLLVAAVMGIASARRVEVNLTTTYLASPVAPVLETSAFLAEVEPSLFFRYIDAVATRSNAIKRKDSMNYTSLALEAASDVLPSDATIAKLVPFVLATRAQSPKIEMFHQLAIESAYKGCGLAYEDATSWAVLYHETGCAAHVICDINAFEKAMLAPRESSSCAASGEHDFELPVDNILNKELAAPTVIVYGTLGTEPFQRFHRTFLVLAEAQAVRYIVRHAPQGNVEPVLLQGYGVSLHIKNMEYKSFDDSKSPHSKHTPSDDDEDEFIVSVMMKKGDETKAALKEYQLEFEDFSSVNSTDDEEPWQLTQLGYLAAREVLTASDPLARLQHLSQNFPKYASALSLATEPVAFDSMSAMGAARRVVQSHQLLNKVVVNGMAHDLSDATFNPFDFLKLLAAEVQQGDALAALELDAATLAGVHSAMTSLSTRATDVRVRVRGAVDGLAPLYLNAIERDASTADWPSDLSVLTEPAWNLIFLRKVMYEVVVVVDPTSKEGAAVLQQIQFLILRGAPVQFGMLWTSPDLLAVPDEDRAAYEPAVDNALPATAYHITKLYLAARDHGADEAKQFLAGIIELGGGVTVKEALLVYVQAVTHALASDEALEAARTLLRTAAQDDAVWAMTDLVRETQLPLDSFVFNGVVRRELNLQESLMSHFGRDQPLYQELARAGKLADDMDLLDELLAQETAYQVYSPWLDPEFDIPTLNLHLSRTDVWDGVRYLHMAGTATKPKQQSLVLIVDLDTPEGARSAHNALKTVLETPETRLSLVHRGAADSLGARLGHIAHAIGDSDEPRHHAVLLELLRLVGRGKTEADVVTHGELFVQLHADAVPEDALLPQVRAWLTAARDIAHPLVALLSPATDVLLVNGRPVERAPTQELTPALIRVLLQFEADTRSKAVAKALFAPTKHEALSVVTAARHSHALYHVLAVVDAYLATPRTGALFPEVDPRTTVVAAGGSLVDVVAYLDPLSEASQRASVFLRMLRDVLGASISLVLVPTPTYTEFPLKRFYRYAWGHAPVFAGLPRPPVLTMNVETPELFNVQMVHSDGDVDNIRGDAAATYAVQSVLVYGQCIDRTMAYHPSPPNGLQLTLERTAGTTQLHRDTVVMKNLGYFQLQATPGVWRLELANGRASELYQMVDQQAADHARVIVHDFLSAITQLEVKKRPGFEYARLLDDAAAPAPVEDAATQSYWRSLVAWGTGGAKDVRADGRTGETIHVFSVATGHLYERMLKLMMLSVLKRTSNPVTFWLLENFLSPDFKKSVAALQAEFGMDIRLVTYKWPNWLRRQTEKQRIIWGYKILFLDVLFPLGVQKIIYVDADQVVRADLKELWTMDLHGKAYGYTPFCDSRNVGFQFWRQGYWKDHLRGKPYHISALYVVDLVKFRRMAAGDTLRAIYDQLSADPNSLSNLDQDLPNYAQHQIPIHSLPQEWLWCESWCSDDSKAVAKTIDLCNNPKHKEPKLDMAKRVISGEYFQESWLELDEEVKAAEKAYFAALN
ncbi:UDP-glucose:glycoprotein glucosyltransferase [Achlya hypogyna]|uniref:UDP-glucose:glycoprotein glucosyltransferase n=1 Tax=Achlya hypogyna TaxID=1202772 RepID=A0A1V9ZLK4_ACHHY|nr:UDP-glucose:glycoprotein glucosyltransferase [Achlya hypogyna]